MAFDPTTADRPTTPCKPRLLRADLRPYPGGATLIIAPSGRMYCVQAPPDLVGKLLRRCDGTSALPDIVRDTSDPAAFEDILLTLLADGCLTEHPPHPDEADWQRFDAPTPEPQRLATTHLLMLGDETLLTGADRMALTSRLASQLASRQVVTLDSLPAALDAHDAEHTVVLALRTILDAPFLRALDELCDARGVRWCQFHVDQGKGWLGPAIVPGRTAGYHDLLVRRLSVADEPDGFQAIIAPPLTVAEGAPHAPYLPPATELAWMLATFFAEVERWLVGAPCRLLSTEMEADPVTLTCTPYPVLPLPERVLTGDLLISAPKDTSLLVNERCGVILRYVPVHHHESVPATLATAQTHVCHMAYHYPSWPNDAICGGSSFDSFTAARDSAIGEAIERYCGNYMPGCRPIRASYDQIIARGEYALDPESLILFSERTYQAEGCPFVPFTRDLELHWVQGYSLTRDCPAWVPLSYVYVNWYAGEYGSDPVVTSVIYSGIAAGETMEYALVSGIEEVIERDATMIWWLNHHPLPAIRLTPELEALWEGTPTELGQRAWAIYLDNEFDIPVIAGVVKNEQDQWLNIGFAARPDAMEATKKAWTEALTLQEGSRDLDDPNGLIRESVKWGWLPDVFKPWRPDRRYLDDFRADFRDVNDLMAQQQVFLDPRAIERASAWVEVPATLDFDALPRLPDRSLATYCARIESKGYEIFYVDVTAPDIAHTGMKAARVIIPGLVPNFPAAFPPTGKGRVQTVPVTRGWRTTPLSEEELNYLPIPHA